ncbi:MAG: 16S rRNA (uracil(1498)-N(3))-methyltransferase [Ignavibacteriae bacterium]|nr:16S rRNA (uracil(1498)-N(3))-methyltransferase [Ignavibacteriota bacterium]
MTSAHPSENEAHEPPHGLEFFYAPPQAISNGFIRIDGDEFVHLSHVMRRTPGDIIGVADGQGTAYTAEVVTVEKRMAVCKVRTHHPMLHESPVRVILAAALLKNPSRYDFLIEKATEIGVSAIIPLITDRTIPRQARTERWQKLALAAMKQSGRCVLPPVHEPVTFPVLMERSASFAAQRWLFHEAAEDSGIIEAGSHMVIIGPEGGFTDGEVALAVKNNCAAIRLGPRRLRSETAAVAATARFLL